MSWCRPAIFSPARSLRAFSRNSTSRTCPNLTNAWAEIANRLANYDPGNQYAVNYMWGTTGIGYNVKAARDMLGETASVDFLG